MRALAFTALEQYDIGVERLRLINNETNCTFRVDATDGRTFALRISLPDVHSLDAIQAEIDWQRAIVRETDIPVPHPIPSRSGGYIVTAGARGVPEERHCVLFSWLHGRTLEDVASPESFRQFGALVARLHRYGKEYRPPNPEAIRSQETLYPFGDREMLLKRSTAELFPPSTYETFLEMRRAVQRELDWLFSRNDPPQVLHGDLHLWNVLSYRGKLQPIDFEDVSRGYPVRDVAISLYYSARKAAFPELKVAFREGYETIAAWPEMYHGQIKLHMVHRAIDLFNFVLGSTLRHDQELLNGFIENFQNHHCQVFDSWRSGFRESHYR